MGLHLNFISTDPNEEIKEGDWIIKIGEFVKRAGKSEIDYLKIDKNYFHKIIASTDPSLGLPAIPLTWIRDVYVPSNGSIKEVMLEIEEVDIPVTEPVRKYYNETKLIEKIKLTPNNEVVIVDEPKPFTKEEFDYQLKHVVPIDERKTWAKENWPKVVHPNKSVDQELEDAANKASLRIYVYESEPRISRDVKIGFIDGANWKAEQVANDAIEFFNWVKQEYREFHTIMENNKPVTSYVHRSNGGVPSRIEKLYELWQQSK